GAVDARAVDLAAPPVAAPAAILGLDAHEAVAGSGKVLVPLVVARLVKRLGRVVVQIGIVARRELFAVGLVLREDVLHALVSQGRVVLARRIQTADRRRGDRQACIVTGTERIADAPFGRAAQFEVADRALHRPLGDRKAGVVGGPQSLQLGDRHASFIGTAAGGVVPAAAGALRLGRQFDRLLDSLADPFAGPLVGLHAIGG